MIYRRDEGEVKRYGFNYGKSCVSDKFNTFTLLIPWFAGKAFKAWVYLPRLGTIAYKFGLVSWYTDVKPKDLQEGINNIMNSEYTQRSTSEMQLKDAELLRSKPGGFKQLGSMGKSYKIGEWIDPRLFFKGDNE